LVEYIGDPDVSQEISGAGELRPIAGGAPVDAATPATTPIASPTATTRPTRQATIEAS
jgi:hypothetical protein